MSLSVHLQTHKLIDKESRGPSQNEPSPDALGWVPVARSGFVQFVVVGIEGVTDPTDPGDQLRRLALQQCSVDMSIA